ncbi:hypothetical protein GCM10023187_53870 [Nibrella viscosa]|uniref:Uncharacterized protein n=1 Tax=Nibrella viscosa TaxID=1084524 RepID=A0ABP8L008_9BACT
MEATTFPYKATIPPLRKPEAATQLRVVFSNNNSFKYTALQLLLVSRGVKVCNILPPGEAAAVSALGQLYLSF